MEDVEFGRNLRHTVHPHEIVIPSRPELRLRSEDAEESVLAGAQACSGVLRAMSFQR
jgi:hypothetical protein